MSSPIISTVSNFASVQMAAEAVRLSEVLAGTLGLEQALRDGNNRNSRFPATLAKEFADTWKVLDHRVNTGTGFSGTLFENKATNEPVLSLRSTEFVDDVARDSKATNELEVRGPRLHSGRSPT
jgi:hypothetical protein